MLKVELGNGTTGAIEVGSAVLLAGVGDSRAGAADVRARAVGRFGRARTCVSSRWSSVRRTGWILRRSPGRCWHTCRGTSGRVRLPRLASGRRAR